MDADLRVMPMDLVEPTILGLVSIRFSRNLSRKEECDLLEFDISAIEHDFLVRGNEQSVVMKPTDYSFVVP